MSVESDEAPLSYKYIHTNILLSKRQVELSYTFTQMIHLPLIAVQEKTPEMILSVIRRGEKKDIFLLFKDDFYWFKMLSSLILHSALQLQKKYASVKLIRTSLVGFKF